MKKKLPKSQKITVRTAKDHTHSGYRNSRGRSVIYEKRESVKDPLARYNYNIPHEKIKGKKALKADMFFSSEEYGKAISKAWNHLAKSKGKKVRDTQKAIDKIFKSFSNKNGEFNNG